MTIAVKKSTGEVYTGWKSVRVTTTLDDSASTFELEGTDMYGSVILNEGDKVQILYDNQILITSYIDRVEEHYSATDHSIQVIGRSLTKDLIDCSANPNSWPNTKLSFIVQQLVNPYNLKVIIEPGLDYTVDTFSVKNDENETVIQAIQRLAARSQLIVTDNEYGNIVLTQAGSSLSPINITNKKGDSSSNVLEGSSIGDEQQRYSIITARSQIRGTDTNFGTSAQKPSAFATDNVNVFRYRPLIIDANEQLNQSDLQELVDWQIGYNTGKSRTLKYTVQGWGKVINGNYNLWQLNTLVSVYDDMLGFMPPNDDMLGFMPPISQFLITELEFEFGEGGTKTEITLHPKEAYIPAPKGSKLYARTKVKHGKKNSQEQATPWDGNNV
jgi:prophage tail gpP-like protein